MTEPRDTPPTGPLPSGVTPVPQRPDITYNWGARGSSGNRSSTQFGGPGLPSMGGGQFSTTGGSATPDIEFPGRDQLSDIGKTTTIIGSEAPQTLLPEDLKAPDRTPGFFEGMLGGLIGAFTGIVPDPIRGGLIRGGELVGEVLDLPGEALGHIPINQMFGLENTEQAFELLPMTNDKVRVMQAMKADPTEAQWYMSQYLRTHAGDYAAEKGLPQLLAQLIRPDATIQERFFTALGVPAQYVARLRAEGGLGIFGNRALDILNNPDLSDPALVELRDRYLRGEFGTPGTEETLNRLEDEIVTAGYGWHDDPFISMLGEMVTDPIIIASMGSGLALGAVRTGSLARHASNVARIARTAAETDVGVASAVAKVESMLAADAIKTGRVLNLETVDSTYQFAKQFAREGDVGKAISQQGLEELRTNRPGLAGQKDYYAAKYAPVIETTAKVSEVINSPFGFFGRDGVGGILSKKFARDASDGVFAAYGLQTVGKVYDGLPNNTALNNALGHALAYTQRSGMQANLIRFVRMQLTDATGRITGNAKLPDTMANPDTLIERMMGYKVDASGKRVKSTTRNDINLQAQQIEVQARRQAKEYQPNVQGVTPERRAESYKAQMVTLRQEAAKKLARAADIDLATATKIVADADEKMLSFIDYAHWGKTIEEFIEVQQVAASRVQKGVKQAGVDAMAQGAGDLEYQLATQQLDIYDIANRATLVGENELTLQAATQLLKDLAALKDEADRLRLAQSAVEKYEVLHQNFYEKTRITSDADFIDRVQALVKDGVENERYVSVIKPETLAADLPELAAFRQTLHDAGAPYEIGLAPARDKRWRPVYNEKNELVGYHPWMDVRVTPEDVSAPTTFDLLRERVMTPIRGENIMQESRRKFNSVLNSKYGVGRASSKVIWDAIRESARDQRITMRGFAPHEFRAILDGLDIPEWDKQQLGYRGLADAVARAMEGDLAMVGLTSKVTGISKTRTSGYMNYIGVLSEKIYPLVRFNMNPLFQMQEFIEPYFFNVLRGVKPGMKFSAEQVGVHNLLDEFNMAEKLADGFEAREFMMAGQIHARNMAGPGTVLNSGEWHDVFGGRVATAKRVNYYNEVRKLFGDYLHDAFEREMPGQWGRLEAHFNEQSLKAGGKANLTRGEIAESYFLQKGAKHADNDWAAIHHYDGAVPDDMGRIRGITQSSLARQFSKPSGVELRAAALDPLDNSITEWGFKEALVGQGFTPEYARRAWAVTIGPTVSDVLDSIEGDFADKGVVGFHRELAEALLNRAAITKGISVDELVARKFTQPAQWLDHNARLPLRAYTQLADRLGLEWNMPALTRDDPRFPVFEQRVLALYPKAPRREVVVAHTNAAKKEFDGTAPALLPTQIDKPVNIAGLDVKANKTTEEFTTWIDNAGLADADVQDIAIWYEQLSGMFGGMAYGMPEETVNLLRPLLPEPDLPLDEVRAEIGARLFMSWMSTQVQASPQQGLKHALVLMDEVARGRRPSVHAAAVGGDWKPHRYGVQASKYYAMLRDFDPNLPDSGFGVKLYDFTDSSRADARRTFAGFMPDGQKHLRLSTGELVDMEPGAMDIWAMRERGFVDGPMLGFLANRLAFKTTGAMSKKAVAEALIEVQKQTGILSPDPKGKEKMPAYRARMRAFEAEHGLPEGSMKAAWSGTPSPAEYEKALKQYNDLADGLNSMDGGDGWKGRGYKNNPWTVREIQSIAWVQMRNEFEVGDYNIQHFNSAQLQFTNNPSPHMPNSESLPINRATEHARDLMAIEVSGDLAERVQRLTGVTVTKVVPGTQGKTAVGIVDNTFWEVMGSPEQLQDAARVLSYLTQSDVVHGLKPSEKTASGRGSVWAIDFVVDEADPRVLDGLGRWLDTQEDLQWNGYGTGSMNDGRMAVRSVYDPNEATRMPGAVKVPQSMKMADFEKRVPMPDAVAAKLADGSWATEAGFDHAIPVTPERNVYDNYTQTHEWADDAARADARIQAGEDANVVWSEEMGRDLLEAMVNDGREATAKSLVTNDMAGFTAATDAAFKRADSDAWAVGRGTDDLIGPYRGGSWKADTGFGDAPADGAVLTQRGTNSRGQPVWNAATQWASGVDAAERIVGNRLRERRGTISFREGRADVTSVAHELLHIFSDDLDPSAVKTIHSAFFASADGKRYLANGGTKPTGRHAHNRVIREAEEWMATAFEEWLSTGVAPNGTMNGVFRDYSQYYQTIRTFTGQNVDPALDTLFGKMNPEMHKGPGATYDVDEFRLMEAARVALLKAEEEAFRTHYYKRGRTWLERSINHPYLGLYPASYMWGKVLPELMRFLVRKPFGVEAPFAGLAMANHVYEAIQLELNTDDGALSDLIEEFPEALRFLQLMVPGTPWDIPVNAPAWTRRIAQDAWAGKDPDFGRAITDTAMYAFGPGRAPQDVLDAGGQMAGMVQRLGQMATGEYKSPDEREAEAEREKRLRSLGVMPPEEEPNPVLIPGRGGALPPTPPAVQ